ncbi:hypothetical protein BJ742DRAFT_803349 [Cladochytrium replicatum]|nr:hypothetical protein BJ742DRAFT_803349 [Cladochytrium replicatum]
MSNSDREEMHLDGMRDEVYGGFNATESLRGRSWTSAFFSTIVVNGKESSGCSIHRTVNLKLDSQAKRESPQARNARAVQSDPNVEKKRGRAASHTPQSGETRPTKRSQSHPPNLNSPQSSSSSADSLAKRIRTSIAEEPEVQSTKKSARKVQQPLQTPDVIEMHPSTPLVSLPTPKQSLMEVEPGSDTIINATEILRKSPSSVMFQNAFQRTRRHPLAFVATAAIVGGVIGYLVYSRTDRDRAEITLPDVVLTMIEPVGSTSQPPHSPIPAFTAPKQRLTSPLPPPRSADLRALLATAPRDETPRASLRDVGVVLFLRGENQMQAERLREQQDVIDRFVRNAQSRKEDFAYVSAQDEQSFHLPFDPPIRPTASSLDRLHASDVSSGELPFVRSSVHELRSTQSSATNSPLTMSVTSAELEASMIGAGVQVNDERTAMAMAGVNYGDEGVAGVTSDEWDHV